MELPRNSRGSYSAICRNEARSWGSQEHMKRSIKKWWEKLNKNTELLRGHSYGKNMRWEVKMLLHSLAKVLGYPKKRCLAKALKYSFSSFLINFFPNLVCRTLALQDWSWTALFYEDMVIEKIWNVRGNYISMLLLCSQNVCALLRNCKERKTVQNQMSILCF